MKNLFRWLIPSIAILCLSKLSLGQKHYTINIPSKKPAIAQNTAPSDPAGLSALELVAEIGKMKNLQSSVSCMQKINPILTDSLTKVMKTLKGETAYVIVINWDACKLLTVRPEPIQEDKNNSLFDETMSIYHISLHPQIHRDPVIIPQKSTVNNKFLLATHQNEEGKWIALGPYLVSDPFSTEAQAIASLFFKASDLAYISSQGKFKIYAINAKIEEPTVDVRAQLQQLGVNIP